MKKAGKGVMVWGRVPAPGNVTIVPSRGKPVTLHVNGSYFVKRLRTRASSYRLKFGFWTSRTARPS